MENLLIFIIFILIFAIAKISSINDKLHEEIAEKNRVEKSKKISKAVKKGQNVEKVIPFFENFPHYGKQIVVAFQPIDYIVFDKDEIIMVELKTGKSKLSTKQRNIKKLIEEGKVRFEEILVDDSGLKVK